jgi:addiction module HigA family antidote
VPGVKGELPVVSSQLPVEPHNGGNEESLIEEEAMLPRNRRPNAPGEILRHEFLEPLGLSQKELAQALGITRVRLSEILRGRRAITPDTAFRLGRFFDTTAEFWLGLQTDIDLWDTLQDHHAEYEKIKPVKAAA